MGSVIDLFERLLVLSKLEQKTIQKTNWVGNHWQSNIGLESDSPNSSVNVKSDIDFSCDDRQPIIRHVGKVHQEYGSFQMELAEKQSNRDTLRKDSFTLLKDATEQGAPSESYIRPKSDRPNSSVVSDCENISVIALRCCDDKHLIVRQIRRVYQENNFFHGINHGVVKDIIEKRQGVAFSLPVEQEMKLYSDDPSKSMRLSTSFNVKKETIHNWRDYLRLHCYPLDKYLPEWPSNPSSIKEIVSKYCKEVRELGMRLEEATSESLGLEKDYVKKVLGELGMRLEEAISESLGLEKDYVKKVLGEQGQHMAINYYPECPEPDLTYGLPGHTDPNALTILLQDLNVSGLQVLKQGRWVAVKPHPDAFVINIGDQFQDFPSLLEYWSNSRDFNSKILPCILFFVSLFGAGHAQTPDLTREGYFTSKNISHKHDELPPRTSRVEKNWIQGIDWTDIIMFIGIMLLVLVVYCYKESLSAAFCILWTYITDLMQTLKRTMKQTWIKMKENSIKYLGTVFQLSNIALSSPFLGGAHKWKASMVAGIAVFAIICYCGKISVELKRAGVTATFFYPETRNNKKMFFFTARHVLEFLVPLAYSLLACVYLTELDTKNHRTENDWKSVAFNIQVFIHVIGGLLAFMNARSPYYFRHGDQNQMVPMQPIDTIPRKGNEIILKDKPLVAEELSEEVADMNV